MFCINSTSSLTVMSVCCVYRQCTTLFCSAKRISRTYYHTFLRSRVFSNLVQNLCFRLLFCFQTLRSSERLRVISQLWNTPKVRLISPRCPARVLVSNSRILHVHVLSWAILYWSALNCRYFDVINVKVNTAEINGVLEKNAQEFLTRATSPPELTGCLSELPFIRIMMRKS